MTCKSIFTGVAVVFLSLWAEAQARLVREGGAVNLVVDGRPFLVLGGELGNSSASDMTYMAPFWDKFTAMHLNTILSPVYWELMEPAEGRFDFSLVDSMVSAAERHGLRLILLWFGSWKNSMSCYAPGWVKTNPERFPRAVNNAGHRMEILSAFSENNLAADCKAFGALMKHLRETDRSHTVIMVQVENEIGMLEAARERGAVADAAFGRSVPGELMRYLVAKKDSLVPELRARWADAGFGVSGSWETVFGKGLNTEEIFQAWYYARYANRVAEAGKAVYALPMYVNAALNHRHVLPGQYPSAGPLPQVMDIWQAGAPAIDLLSPDFYNPRFAWYCDLYVRRGNPLFIPEIRTEASNAAKVFYAVGHYHALGFSPFSIESVVRPADEPVGKSYGILGQLMPALAKGFAMDGVLLDSVGRSRVLVFGEYRLTVSHEYVLGWAPEAKLGNWPASGAIVIEEAPGEFIVAGTGVVVEFAIAGGPVAGEEGRSVGILRAEEGVYVDGVWRAGRRMNGDQDHQGRHIRIAVGDWAIQRVKLYTY